MSQPDGKRILRSIGRLDVASGGAVAVALVPLVLVPGLGAAQGGFQPDAWVWAGTCAAWLAAVALAVSDHPGALRENWRWLVFGGGLLLWTLASTVWSAVPAQSLLEARRMVLYAAVALALVVLARRRAGLAVLTGVHAGVSLLVLYALGRYLLGARHAVPYEDYMISQPLGYANAVGILSAIGMLLSLGPATGGSDRRRAAAAAVVPLLALTLLFSGSNASWLALAAGLAAFVVLHPLRLEVTRPLLALLPPTAVAVVLGHFSRLAGPGHPRLAGPVVLLVALGCAVAAAGVAARSRPQVRRRRQLGPRTLAGAAVAVVVLAAIVAVRAAVSEPRVSYYAVAWHEYGAHPLLGSGAGTFGRYWAASGLQAKWGGALDAHSLYLETLAELGPLGLALLAAFLLYPLWRAATRRQLPRVPAAAGATVAFLVHAGLDWDWELPSVVIAGLACTAGLAFADDGPTTPLRRRERAAALAAALVLGAAAIAGARSTTEPSSAPQMAGAPRSGAPAIDFNAS